MTESKNRRTLLHSGVAALATMAVAYAAPAMAQDYPARPIQIVVPYPAGGSTDVIARLVAAALGERLKQTVTVDNRPGAGGVLAHQFVAGAQPDGYTLLISAAGPLTVTPHTYGALGYDPVKAFAPVALLATQPLLLVLNPTAQMASVGDVLRQARERPGKLTYGSFGNGSAAHLAGEYFKSLTKADIVHVPYKGAPPALVDLMGGRIDMMFDVFSNSSGFVKSGKLKALAITSAERSPELPDVPTMQQAGIADFQIETWFAMLAPTGTPPAVVETLSRHVNAALRQGSLRRALLEQGAVIRGGPPDELKRLFDVEYLKWGEVVKKAGIRSN